MEFIGTDQGRLVVLAVAAALVAGAFWFLRQTRSAPSRKIRVVGVGGAGSNAIDAMKRAGLRGVDYVAVNTDVAALNRSTARTKIVIGRSTSQGLGAGGDVSIGTSAARGGREHRPGDRRVGSRRDRRRSRRWDRLGSGAGRGRDRRREGHADLGGRHEAVRVRGLAQGARRARRRGGAGWPGRRGGHDPERRRPHHDAGGCHRRRRVPRHRRGRPSQRRRDR